MVQDIEQAAPTQTIYGPIFILNRPPILPIKYTLLTYKEEHKRLVQAQEILTSHLNTLRCSVEKKLGSDCASIFEAHITLLQELTLETQVVSLLEQEHATAEYAIQETAAALSQLFSQLDSPYMQARGVDIQDISYQLCHTLFYGIPYVPTLQSPALLITEELYPSELMGLPPSNLLGVVCQHGSTDSHTAQLLQHEKIPFCMGVFFDFPTIATTALVDMVNNRIYFDPDLEMRQSLGYEENHAGF